MPKVEYETDETLVEVNGFKVPESVKAKFIEEGQLQAVSSIRRKAEGKLSNVFDPDFNWTSSKPAEIIDNLSRIITEKETAYDELKNKTPEPIKGEPDDDKHTEEMREMKDQLSQMTAKHEKALVGERSRNLSQESLNEIKSQLITGGLNEDQQPLFKSMIDTHFESSVESGKMIFKQKGAESDYYVDGNLATPKDIAKFIKDKFPGSFSTVKPGAGTGRTASTGNNGSVSGMDKLKDIGIRKLEESVW